MTAPQAYRGEKIGLPRSGAGSIAASGPRLGAFVVDSIASALVAALFVRHGFGGSSAGGSVGIADQLPRLWVYVPFAVDYIVGVLVAGRTLGMYLFGLRLVRVTPGTAVDPFRIVFRTLLLCLLIPAIVFDRDGRGLHDRFADTAVVRA